MTFHYSSHKACSSERGLIWSLLVLAVTVHHEASGIGDAWSASSVLAIEPFRVSNHECWSGLRVVVDVQEYLLLVGAFGVVGF
jgi:hypothetical protein